MHLKHTNVLLFQFLCSHPSPAFLPKGILPSPAPIAFPAHRSSYLLAHLLLGMLITYSTHLGINHTNLGVCPSLLPHVIKHHTCYVDILLPQTECKLLQLRPCIWSLVPSLKCTVIVQQLLSYGCQCVLTSSLLRLLSGWPRAHFRQTDFSWSLHSKAISSPFMAQGSYTFLERKTERSKKYGLD